MTVIDSDASLNIRRWPIELYDCFWPVPVLAVNGNDQQEGRQERQVSARNWSFSLGLYNQCLNDGNRPDPGVENVPL